MFTRNLIRILSSLLGICLLTGVSHAADYYVSPAGAATWANCSGSTPLSGASACSWQTAMANAVAGDVVYFRGGAYEPGDAPADGYTPAINPTNSGTVGNPIVFKAYQGETPIIIDGSGPVFGASKRSYITWDGFQSTMSENTQVGKIIEIDSSDNIIIQNCDLRGIPSLDQYNKSGIQIDWSNHVYIYNNKFSAFNGSNVNTGAVWNMSNSYVYFYNNDVYDSEKGFMTKFWPNYIYVYNNYFYNTNIAYYHLPSLGVSPGTDYFVYQNVVNSGSLVYSPDASGINTNLNIYNNTVYNNTNGAIQIGNNIYHNTRNSKIYNNIIYTITGTPAFLMYNSTEDRPDYSDYNLLYGNGNWRWDYFTTISSLASWISTTGFDANSLTSDPLFVNVGGANPTDYKLQVNSPARTSGRGGSYATVMGAYIIGNEIIGYDPDAPRVEITSPPNSTVTTTNTSISLQGTASDTQGIVSVTCNNSRGGSCTCTGTTNWTCSNIPLQTGQNIITVTATDGDNKAGIDAITVTVSSGGGDTGGNTGGGGGDSASGGSGCGFVKDNGKGRGAKGEGVALMIMLIITLSIIAIARRVFKRKTTTVKTRSELLNFKTGLIGLTILFLFAASTPAHATVYLNLNAEEGTVGATVPYPPFEAVNTSVARATYQSSGGTPQGSKYYQWQTVNSQLDHLTAMWLNNSTPITNIIGNTYYLAYYFRFDRINGLDIWHEFSSQSYDKLTDIMGSGVRWTFKVGQHEAGCYTQNQDHRFTVGIGNSGYNFSGLECVDQLTQNSNGYSASNPIQLAYEAWHSVVIAIKMSFDDTGSVTIYINGIKVLEYNNIRTVADSSSTLRYIYMGGTIAQTAYDAPAHYRKFDAFLFTDNWQDIVDGGYLSKRPMPPSQ